MQKENLDTLKHARITAYISYLGILIPPFGWIFGSISLVNIHIMDKTSLSKEAKKIVKSVKKIAIIAIILSTIIAITMAIFVAHYINEINNKKAEEEKVIQVRQEEATSTCLREVSVGNSNIRSFAESYDKSFDQSDRYYFMLNGGIKLFITNEDGCKNNAQETLSKLENNLRQVKGLCEATASETYDNYLAQNGTKTGTDSNGNAWYDLPKDKIDYAKEVLQDANDHCKDTLTIDGINQ